MIGELCSSLETEAKVAVGLYGDEERPQLSQSDRILFATFDVSVASLAVCCSMRKK